VEFREPSGFPNRAICDVSASETVHFALPLPERCIKHPERGARDRGGDPEGGLSDIIGLYLDKSSLLDAAFARRPAPLRPDSRA